MVIQETYSFPMFQKMSITDFQKHIWGLELMLFREKNFQF